MKTVILSNQSLKGFSFALLTIIFFSCTYPYFNQPQPVDSKNLKNIPKELQGIWTITKDTIKDTIIITKNSYRQITNPDDTDNEMKISKSDMETSNDFKLVNNKLIYVGGVLYYNSVWDYVFENDTFNLTGRLVNQFNLSDSVLLRKTKNLYVCNIQRGNWWEILVMRKEKKGEIKIYILQADELKSDLKSFNLRTDSLYAFKTQLNSEPDTIIYFNAALDARFFEENILNETLFAPIYTLLPDSTFENELFKK
jgi:hypothetical protein